MKQFSFLLFFIFLLCCVTLVISTYECTDKGYILYLNKTIVCPGYDNACSFRHMVEMLYPASRSVHFKDANFYLRHDNTRKFDASKRFDYVYGPAPDN